jgi:hypothetical protein
MSLRLNAAAFCAVLALGASVLSASQSQALTCAGTRIIGHGAASACAVSAPSLPGEATLVAEKRMFGKRNGKFDLGGASGNLLVALKLGPKYAYFLFDNVADGASFGRFSTKLAGIIGNSGLGRKVQRVQVYDLPDTPAPVPVPAAGLMAASGIAALAGLGMLRRRSA